MRALRLVLPVALLAAAACSSDDPVSPRIDPTLVRIDSLDASAGWRYVALSNPGAALALTDAQALTSTQWDIAFRGYDAKINGGETGPGGVTAHCVCANTQSMAGQAPAAQVAFFRALTAESELADYTGVTPAGIPEAATFRSDTVPSIRGWWTQSGTTRAVNASGVYIVNRPDSLGYAKVQFQTIQNATGATPGVVTFRYATLPISRAAYAPTQTVSVNVPATGAIAFSFATNGVVDPTQPYDLLFSGWRVSTNSGVRSTARVASWGAYNATTDLGPNNTASFDATGTRAAATTRFGYLPEGSGVFNLNPSWFYDFTTNQPYPNYDVYLIRRGTAVWKLQVIRHPREATFGSGTWLSRFVLFRTSQLQG